MKIARILLYMTCFFSMNAFAYIEETHQDLSAEALKISNVATDSSLLQDLGLGVFGADQTFPSPNNTNDLKTIRDLIRDGAKFEDAFPRSLSHFYNPINNSAGMGGNTSPDWAIEDNGDITSGLSGIQNYSYKDAMSFFNQALTAQTKQERDENWGKVFQALGQIIHHVQDMAQPDHARNDAHLDVVDSSWYEEFTDDEKGKGYFTSLMPHMTEFYNEITEIEPISTGNEIASFAMLRLENGEIKMYIVKYSKGSDGIWRIHSM